jgi:hypothetical protein
LRNAPAEKFTLGFVDGQLEVQADTPDADDGEAGQVSKDIQWFKDQAQMAQNNPTKKWWTVLDMERDLKMPHSTALRHVADAHVKQYVVKKRVGKKGQGRAAQYCWNEAQTNPLWVEPGQEDEGDAF